MTIDFYYMPSSGPCRAVMMTAKALGVPLNKKITDLMTKEQLKPEFVKLNPQHTIPTIVDNNFVLWESRPILIYLVEQYGKSDDHPLYPKCSKKRAVINQRMYFDMGTLYYTYANYFYPQWMAKQPADPEKLQKFEQSLELLNTFIGDNTYVTGNTLTIADIAILATVSTFEATDFDLTKYKNIKKWYEHCKSTVLGFDENWEGCLLLKKLMQDIRDGKIVYPPPDKK